MDVDSTAMLTEALDGRRPSGEYLTEVVYGANDGIVTTFAVVAGAAGVAFAVGELLGGVA